MQVFLALVEGRLFNPQLLQEQYGAGIQGATGSNEKGFEVDLRGGVYDPDLAFEVRMLLLGPFCGL